MGKNYLNWAILAPGIIANNDECEMLTLFSV